MLSDSYQKKLLADELDRGDGRKHTRGIVSHDTSNREPNDEVLRQDQVGHPLDPVQHTSTVRNLGDGHGSLVFNVSILDSIRRRKKEREAPCPGSEVGLVFERIVSFASGPAWRWERMGPPALLPPSRH